MAASKEDKDSNDPKQSPLSGLYPSSHGKILSPLASRMPYPPYLKHDMSKTAEMYRSFNGPPTSHIPVGHPDYALLESYQRALVAHNGLAATMHHHPLSSIMAAKQSDGGGNPAFAPLSLTTTNTLVPASGASPSTSSTSSRPENTTPDHRQPPPPPSEIATP